MLEFNERLLAKCNFDSIQDAVDKARNNDRIVIMPGIYTEPESRAAPTNDPSCASLLEENDESQTNALSYAYHLQCPNDQSLVNISGRAFGGDPPQPPNEERRGIPATGPCVKCNLQLEGSGPTPNDVVVDAGRVESGNAGPVGAVKDVAIRLDRADGTVIRNLTVRHADEHGIYVLETDGYRLERFKAFYNADYGVLAFTSDHGLMQKCDAVGSGDSGLYPGGSPETGEQTVEGKRRYNTEIRYCDMRHNTAGYSGTDGNAVWLHHNNLYDNANGFTTDVFTASGHPGFPQDSDLLEKNKFYSNNFNPYTGSSDVRPTVPMPVGTGMWIAGGNNNVDPQQLVLRQLAPRDDAVRGSERAHLLAADALDPRLPANRPVNLAPQPVLRQQDGRHPEGQAPAERARLLVGPVAGQRQQLLVQEHRHATATPRASRRCPRTCPPTAPRAWDGRHGRAVGRADQLRRRAPGRPGMPLVHDAAEAKRLAAVLGRFAGPRPGGLRGRHAAGRTGRRRATRRCGWPTATTGTARGSTSA